MALNHTNAFQDLINGTFRGLIQGAGRTFDNVFMNAFGGAFFQFWILILYFLTLFMLYERSRSIEGVAIVNVLGTAFMTQFIVNSPFVDGLLYAISVLGLAILMYKFWRSK